MANLYFKMNKKGNIQIGAIFLLILIFFLFFKILPEATPEARLEINLQSPQIIKGEVGVLFYKITANKDIPLENVEAKAVVLDNNEVYYHEPIGTIVKGTPYIDTWSSILTNNLQKGPHTIEMVVTYSYQGEEKELGLTLGFEVF